MAISQPPAILPAAMCVKCSMGGSPEAHRRSPMETSRIPCYFDMYPANNPQNFVDVASPVKKDHWLLSQFHIKVGSHRRKPSDGS